MVEWLKGRNGFLSMVKSLSLPRRMFEEMEMAMNYLYLVLLLILGLFMTLKPDLMWKVEHFLSTKGGEPSELYRGDDRVRRHWADPGSSGPVFSFPGDLRRYL